MQEYSGNTYAGTGQKAEPYMLYGDRNAYDSQPGSQKDMVAQDLEYLQGLYPGHMKRLQEYVIRACDNMEYKNSPLYDEFPDRTVVNQVCDSICRQIENDGIVRMESFSYASQPGMAEEVEDGTEEVEVYEVNTSEAGGSQAEAVAQNIPIQNRPPQGPPWGPPPGPPPGPRPPQGPPWGPPPGPPPGPRPPQGPPWGPPPGPPPGPRPPQRPPWGPPPPRPPQGPPWGPPPGPPWGPPPRPPFNPGGNWMNDIIKVLLLNEMHRRRCRTGRCF